MLLMLRVNFVIEIFAILCILKAAELKDGVQTCVPEAEGEEIVGGELGLPLGKSHAVEVATT